MNAAPPIRLLALGTNGYLPSFGRQTMSFLLAAPGAALLLDAGSGVARLAEPAAREALEGAARLDILLTHYHLDHVIGLSYLPGVASRLPVRIFAPAPPLTAFGTEALDRLLAPPLFPVPIHRWPMTVEVVPFAGAAFEIGPFAVRVRAQKHPGGSVGVRIGDRLAYITDTILDRSTVEFVRGVEMLLHEVWLDDAQAARDDAGRTGHSAASPVAALAREARVGRLVPVHHHPFRSAVELLALRDALTSGAGCPVELPVEGEPLELG